MIPNNELLRKATLSLSDFGGAGEAPLAIEQVTQFIELVSADAVMLADVRTVTSSAPKWQESVIDFSARIARAGTESTRLVDGDRIKPTTSIVEMNTVLIRGEVPVSDEVYEDNVAGAAFSAALERTIASRFGYDIEDLFLNGDTASSNTYLALLNGWLKLAQGSGGNVVASATYGQDYQEIFKQLLVALPDRHKRGIEIDGRFYVPKRLEEKYRDILASRGTPLGDLSLSGKNELTYQAIKIVGVPSMAITAGSPDTSSVLLANRNNLYAGYQRRMKFETYRDPREGVMSFIITARVDAEVAVVGATAIATSVSVEP